MPGTPGARTGLASILTGDAATAYRTTINAIRDWLEGNAAITSFGTLGTRPTSTSGSPGIAGRRYRATDAFATFRDTGTGWELESQTPQLVTALPTGTGIPFDGQEIDLLLDATLGIVARLRYRAAAPAPYRWERIGGEALAAEVASLSNTSATTYSAWGGPSVTVPLAGDYKIELGFRPYKFDAGKAASFMSFAVGATAAVDADAVQATLDQDTAVSVERTLRKNAIPAGAVLASRFRASGGTWAPANAWLRATPIRVG